MSSSYAFIKYIFKNFFTFVFSVLSQNKKIVSVFDNIGVFHVVHVNRSVNIFLLNRDFFYVTKIF